MYGRIHIGEVTMIRTAATRFQKFLLILYSYLFRVRKQSDCTLGRLSNPIAGTINLFLSLSTIDKKNRSYDTLFTQYSYRPRHPF